MKRILSAVAAFFLLTSPALAQVIGGGILGGGGLAKTTEDVLTRYLYATEGVESLMFFGNAYYPTLPAQWTYAVTCDEGTANATQWSYTPEAADVPSGNTAAIDWILTPSYGSLARTAHTGTLRISKSTAGTGESRKLLLIGESTGAGALTELLNLADSDALTLTTVGQHSLTANDSDAESRTASHEAIGGWSWASLQNTQYSESGDGSSQLSGWTFAGHTSSNTNAGIVYWRLIDQGDNLVVNGGFETQIGDGISQDGQGASAMLRVRLTQRRQSYTLAIRRQS